jgi:hypothetical protein
MTRRDALTVGDQAETSHSETSHSETSNPLHNTGPLPGVVCVQWVPRGPNGRKCGPYYCRMWRQDGILRKQYVPIEHLDHVRARCKAYSDQIRAERETSRESMRLRAEGMKLARLIEEQRP